MKKFLFIMLLASCGQQLVGAAANKPKADAAADKQIKFKLTYHENIALFKLIHAAKRKELKCPDQTTGQTWTPAEEELDRRALIEANALHTLVLKNPEKCLSWIVKVRPGARAHLASAAATGGSGTNGVAAKKTVSAGDTKAKN